eukprot:s5200_g6.t1
MLMTPAQAAETITPDDGDTGLWTIFTILVIGILILGDLVTRFGLPRLRSWFCPKEELKVKLLSETAVLPTRGTEGSAGLDLSASEDYKINSGDYLLIKTGVAVELPRGTYGRLASRSSLASMGVEVSAGVIDRDFRGEIKVLMHNQSGREFWVRRGDRVAQLIVERVMEVEVQQVTSLSETSRELRDQCYATSWQSSTSEGGEPCPSAATEEVRTPAGVEGPAANRCRNPGGEGDGTASAGEPRSKTRIKAEDLQLQRPIPPMIPAGKGPVIRCRNPEEQGDGSALMGVPKGSVTAKSSATKLRSGNTGLMDGPPEGLGICPIGAPMPSSWFQQGASLNERAKCLKVQVKDIVPEVQINSVEGYPGLVSWNLMRPEWWTSHGDESLEELADRSGLAKFWPLHMEEIWEVLEKSLESPERDRWHEIPINSATVMMVRLHPQSRRKIYDFKNDVMDSTWNYGRMHLTIVKLECGSFCMGSGHRFGNASPYLDDRWRGITCFIKVKRA